MRYKVTYIKPKKKGHSSKQVATFFDVESAIFWQDLMKTQGMENIEILVN